MKTHNAEVWKSPISDRWFYYVYEVTAGGGRGPEVAAPTPVATWREAYDAAYRATSLARFWLIQDRINATVKALASVYPVQHLVIDPAKWQAATRPPEPKVWEGDYA